MSTLVERLPVHGRADAHAEFRQRRHFGSLDGLRALSILAVVWHHTGGGVGSTSMLLRAGHHGVTLFFAISGFLIVTLLLRERERYGRIDLRAFYMRRVLRIFPLYYAVLALYVVMVAVFERHSMAGREFFDNLLFFASYTSNWFVALHGRVIFYFSWSLAAEEQFYMLWPSVQRLVTPRRALAMMLAIIAVVATLQWNGPPGGINPAPLWYRGMTSVPLAICFGVVLAHLLHYPRSHRWLGFLLGWQAASLVCLALVAWVLTEHAGLTVMVHLALALLVGSCVYREDHALAPLFCWAPMAYVGTISYGMYLLHMLSKNMVTRLLSKVGLADVQPLVFGCTVLVSVAVASLSYRYFESYFLRRKARYSHAA